MNFSTICTIFLLAITVAAVQGGKKGGKVTAGNTCSGSGRMVREFNGRREETFMPCKYDAVRQQCGRYEINVSPGNVYFRPKYRIDSLWLGITDTETGDFWTGRTDNKIAVKYHNGWNTELFNQKSGSVTTDELLVFGNEDKAGYVEAKNGDFRVSFTPWDPENKDYRLAKWSFTCFANDFEAAGFSKQVCGGTDKHETSERRDELGLKDRTQLIHYDVFTNTEIEQTNPKCANATRLMTEECSESQRIEAVMTCGQILSSKRHTQCITKYSCDPMDSFVDCIDWVCSNYKDDFACERLGQSIDLCRNFRENDLTARVDDAKCFRDFLHINH